MSSANLTPPLTARAFLLGDAEPADTAAVLARELSQHDVARSALRGLPRLSGSALQAVHGEIATVAVGLLDLGLGDALVSGWRKYVTMTKAARRTLVVPGSEAVVVLATHRVTWPYEAHIDVLVDGKKIASFDFEMTVVFDLHGVVAVLRLGDLVALRGGECTITATLTFEGATLARQQRRMDAALVVSLDSPVPMFGDAAIANARLRHRNAPTPLPARLP